MRVGPAVILEVVEGVDVRHPENSLDKAEPSESLFLVAILDMFDGNRAHPAGVLERR